MDFTLPYAMDPAGNYISHERGEKDVVYRCPGCREKVHFRQGTVRESHFAHYPGVSCSKEAVLKRIGQKLFIDKISGLEKPSLHRRCPGDCKGIMPVEIPAAAKIIPNYTMPSGEVVDVMLVDDLENPLLAITISGLRHGGHQASATLRGIPWVAVSGSDILAGGMTWFVESSEGEKDCPECRRILEERRRVEEERRRIDAEKIRKMRELNQSMEDWRNSPSERQAEYERALASLGGRAPKQRSPLDHVGEWTVQGFTLLRKVRACACGRSTPVYTWPDGSPFGAVSVDPDRLPPSISRIEGTDLWTAKCGACGKPFREPDPSNTSSNLGDEDAKA